MQQDSTAPITCPPFSNGLITVYKCVSAHRRNHLIYYHLLCISYHHHRYLGTWMGETGVVHGALAAGQAARHKESAQNLLEAFGSFGWDRFKISSHIISRIRALRLSAASFGAHFALQSSCPAKNALVLCLRLSGGNRFSSINMLQLTGVTGPYQTFRDAIATW